MDKKIWIRFMQALEEYSIEKVKNLEKIKPSSKIITRLKIINLKKRVLKK